MREDEICEEQVTMKDQESEDEDEYPELGLEEYSMLKEG